MYESKLKLPAVVGGWARGGGGGGKAKPENLSGNKKKNNNSKKRLKFVSLLGKERNQQQT